MWFSLRRGGSVEFGEMDLWVFSRSMFSQSYKGHSLEVAEFKDHPAELLSKGAGQTRKKHHDKEPSSITTSILSWQERSWARNVEGRERVRPRPEMGPRQSSLTSQRLWEAIRYLDKPWGYPNWQRWAQSHLSSLSSGVQHRYKIYVSWYTPVRRGLATPF